MIIPEHKLLIQSKLGNCPTDNDATGNLRFKSPIARLVGKTNYALLAALLLFFCSCQSTHVMPQDPFRRETQPVPQEAYSNDIQQFIQVAPQSTATPEPSGTENLIYLPDYKPTYQAEQDTSQEKTRLVQTEIQTENTIQLVNFVDEQESEATPAINKLAIDPALKEQGEQIIASHQANKENLQEIYRGYVCGAVDSQIEYLVDGGDRDAKVYVEEDWTVHNLEAEDTIAHFDTLDGRTLVEPSNRVHLYAPRFAAVRKIEGVYNNDQIIALLNANNQQALDIEQIKEQAGLTAQESQTGYARTRSQLSGVGSRSASAGAERVLGPEAYGIFESVMLYSNWLMQRSIGTAELVHLAEASNSARAWMGSEGIKVAFNAMAPIMATSKEGAASFFQIEEDESQTSKLRLIKVASKKAAQPGDIVEFTLRFDNIGTLPIGNVTILDNLTTRLEFLPGTAKSSLNSGFFVQPNDNGSFTLRFEIDEPLEPFQFGVIQFQCRVR